ncbi:site-specific integrase [Methylobacterium sp. E-025]|uniref:DUF6538 domain-containing protein n=1 Tax=Methylobacterium sp. E-025 TaxID=2836561 RepID=UPI001FB89249|nr:DUF6538 domain-containing protein [Methylobacterium sp. E-025]MCJ2112244.1 site-specific integrase [Methylobacterium sp. E-025]
MVLGMSRPWKHPKTGVYYLRKRVPADLRNVVGTEVVKITLGTKDPTVAKALHLKTLTDLESRWANLRLGAQTLTEREAHSVANRAYEVWVRMHRNDPSFQNFWQTEIYEKLWTTELIDISEANLKEFGSVKIHQSFSAFEMRRFCRKVSISYLTAGGINLDAASESKLEKAIAAAFQRASIELSRMAEGYDQDKDVKLGKELFDEYYSTRLVFKKNGISVKEKNLEQFSLTALLESWWRENKAAGIKPSTYQSYRNTIKYFIVFLGHEKVEAVTPHDIVAFKDHRLTEPSPKTGRVASAKTVKDSDLSALKTLFRWAVSNRKIQENPTLGITIKVTKSARLRSKGFSDAEAVAILAAALKYENTNEFKGTAFVKRWVPWLCAFTGARVGEIAQLRRQDIRWENSRCIIRITPEAGTVKTNEAREVVLHRQLDLIGFQAFIEACPNGHLFLKARHDGDVLGPLQGLKNRLAEFGRSIITDRNVAPNHGWRHRFKTVGMEVGIAPRILDAIQGQAARTVADTYGDVSLKTMEAAIDRLPAFEISNERI